MKPILFCGFHLTGRPPRTRVQNEQKLRKEAENKENCDKIMSEEFKKKEYLTMKNISEVRSYFRMQNAGIIPMIEGLRKLVSSVGARR